MKVKEVKSNYSFRLSDEIVALIDKQPGNSRTEKFENLVFSRVQSIAKLDKQIAENRKTIEALDKRIRAMRSIENNLAEIQRYTDLALRYTEELKAP